MSTSRPMPPFFQRLTDWIYSILIIMATLSVTIIWWGHYDGISGFFRDFWGILMTPLPVPFMILVLLGVGLSISFYRKRSALKDLSEADE